MKILAAEPVPIPREAQQSGGGTNELQKILETQETLINTVNRLREEAEAAARRNEEAIQKLREETLAATQQTKDEVYKSSGALEQLISRQFDSQVDILQKMNHSTVLTFSVLVALGLMAFLGVAFVLWRAMRQMAEPGWAQTHVRVGPGEPAQALGGDPAKALPGVPAEKTVMASVKKLDGLEKRILQLESEAASGRSRGKGGKSPSGPRAASSGEPAEVKESLEKGQALLKSGRPQEALECFDHAVQARPASAEAHLWKGNALEQLGRLDEALAAYDGAIAADPGLNTAHLRKGGICNRLGRLDEAFHSFEQVLDSLGKP